MMHSMSGNRYPVGKPHFLKGKEILNYGLPSYYSFIRIKCRFQLKDKFLPFIQIKGSPYYSGTEMLKDSKPTWKGRRASKITLDDGSVISDEVELTLSCTDYELFHKHYNVYDEEILDGVWFHTDIGMFDDYIDYWGKIKRTSPKGSARRSVSKLYQNNLYGKYSSSPSNISRIPILDEEEDAVEFEDIVEPDKKAVNIAIGAAITSYGRRFTITAAQKNYDSFCYADTDSIHCLCSREEIKGLKVHPTDYCCWKLESFWNEATFTRQKTYIEHICYEDEEPIENPYFNIKCAGMPQNCKELLIESFTESAEKANGYAEMSKIYNAQPGDSLKFDQLKEKAKFLSRKRDLSDFKPGLTVPGKLMPKRIPGGTLLVDTTFTLR